MDWNDNGGGPPSGWTKPMNTYIIQQALSVGVQGRDEHAVATLRDPHLTNGARQAVGAALVSIGQRISGQMPVARNAQRDPDSI